MDRQRQGRQPPRLYQPGVRDAAIAEYKRERRVARALQTILKEAPDLS